MRMRNSLNIQMRLLMPTMLPIVLSLSMFTMIPSRIYKRPQPLFALEIINDFTVASGSSDGFIKFWNFLNGTFLNSIQNPVGGVSSIQNPTFAKQWSFIEWR